jgi:hypothetical protein
MRQVLHQYPFLDSRAKFPGLSDSPEIDGVLDAIKQASTLKETRPLVDKLNVLLWQYLPVIVLGRTTPDAVAIKNNVKGYQDLSGPILWNLSVPPTLTGEGDETISLSPPAGAAAGTAGGLGGGVLFDSSGAGIRRW